MTSRCPFAAWRPITANFSHGGRQRIRGFVPHVQVGTGSLFGFFNTPKPPGEGASADFWCSKSGVLEQYVDLADQAWAQGSHQYNGNPYMVSCEFEGDPSEPMTPEQIDMGGRLIAWIVTDVNPFALVVNTIPGNDGITPHHVFGGGHTCPGPGPREGQFFELVAAANQHLGTPPAPPPEDDSMRYMMVIHVKDGGNRDAGYQPVDPRVWAANPGSDPVHVDTLANTKNVLESCGHQLVVDGNPNYIYPVDFAGEGEHKVWPVDNEGAAKFHLPTAR